MNHPCHAGCDHLSVREYGASHGSHDHDHFQVLVGLEGVLELEVSGSGRRIAAGDGCVVPPGERHDFESRTGARCLVLDSHASEWARVGAALAPPATRALANYLDRAVTDRLPRAQQLGPSLLLEAWLRPLQATPQRHRRAIDWDALARWALSHTDAAPTVADLAERVHLSAAQLAARCREERGQSTQQWLREMRLARARAWRAQGLNVAEVARRSGYRSPSALTAARRRVGI
ncbi:MAG: helix-turn-helix domain-containing protein [Hydrogenophaga sp.]|uniref:helix-turn-helix domain-containing protein n=1 Tax=Hydrogenophaga sp. TaxID=1904254 RepID=UPI003D113373